MRFEHTRFACIDFETTGFSPKSSRAIELAIVGVQHGEIGDSWTSLLNPGPLFAIFDQDLRKLFYFLFALL